ncbi:insulinase family protein [Actinoplanes sp. NPDC026619]|uniref:M16 family metallopeptidase n=1 Tax=Actinoplanes sp. NPDC026619 TaxID=3155798 RepID=UPI0033C4F405
MIKKFEVGGVPGLLAPTTGPMQAGLAFRVGFTDEPLAKRGITHLIEHLSLHSVGVADYHYNGATGVEFTRFHMQGAEKDVVAFLNGVCAALRDLPMRRLAVEKEVLEAEAHGRSASVSEPMWLWRHGARDYGAGAYPEWGLPSITEDDLRAWVARYFTRENAVLWVAGDAVPAGLELDLPSGTRQPLPEPSSALPVTPACFGGSPGLVAWDTVVPRSAASSVFAEVLERMLFRELRQESGLSYAAQTDYQPTGRDRVVITAAADCLPENSGAVLGGMVDVLATLRAGRVDPADVTAVISKRVEGLRHAEEVAARLPGLAVGLLAGRDVLDVDEQIAGLTAVTPADVAAVAAGAWANGLIMAPSRADWAGFAIAPPESLRAVTGTEFKPLGDVTARLVVGPEGASLVEPHNLLTVRFDECVLMRAWPDGGRQLIGADGIVVWAEPTLHRGGREAVKLIDAAVPPERVVVQAIRNPEQIPQPRTRSTTPTTTASTSDRVSGILGLIVFWPLTLIFGALGALLFLSLSTDAEDVEYTIVIGLLCIPVTIIGIIGIRRSLYRMRYGPRKSRQR